MTRTPSWSRQAKENIATDDEIVVQNIVEVIAHLELESCSPRECWNLDWTFSGNVGYADDVQPFYAIITTGAETFHPRCHSKVISTDDIMLRHPLWEIELGRYVRRTPQNIRDCLVGIMQMGDEIVLVDPYFNPRDGRYDKTMRLLFASIAERDRKLPSRVELVCSRSRLSNTWTDTDVSEWLARTTPKDLRVQVISVDDVLESQALHDRFVLSDLGGVHVGNSLSEVRGGAAKVTITSLPKSTYIDVWEQFGDVVGSFNSACIIGG